MQQDPWAEFRTAPAQQQPAPIPAQPQRAPGIIRGPERAPDPVEQERLQNDRTRLDIAQNAEARAAQQAERGSVEQGKAASFLQRAINAETNFRSLGQVEPRNLVGQALKESMPNVANVASGADRQRADQAEREFIAAILRYDSGAAIPPEEFVTTGQIYFPRPGDTPETLAQKAEARRVAIQGLKAASGPLGERIELPDFDQMQERAQGGGEPPAPAPENRDDASAAMLDPTVPPEKSYGDDGSGNPLVVMQNGKLYGQARGQFEGEESPGYVEIGGKFDDLVTAGAADLAQRITSMEQSMRERRGEGGFKEVGSSGITLGLSDEAAGIGSALGAALTGDFDVGANFEAGRAVEDLRIQQGRDNMGLAATGLELAGAGGAIRAASAFGQARQAVRGLQNSGRAINRASVQGAMRNRATAEGAGIGVIAGGAQGSTLEERGQNALVGGMAGGVLGRVGQNVQNALANRAVTQSGAALPSGAQAQQAADSLGIDLIPAVTGGTTAQRLTSGARQGFISDRPIASAVERMETQGAAARTRASEMAGDAVDAEDAGELVRRGAQVYSRRTSQIGGNLYERADRMAGGVKLPLPKATQALDDEIASLQQSPTADSSSLLRDLQNLRDQISQGQFSIPGIRAMRTDLRQEIVARGLRFSPSDAIYSRVLRAAEDDLIGGLRQAGKDNAANALQTASNFWRRRVETIDEVLDPILGKNAPRSGEQILAAVERLAKPDSGSSVNLGRLMRAMPDGEASAVRATVINRLGRPTAGAAEVDREGFSFATFLTNWNNMSPRARSALFPRESREALDQLATVAQRVKAAGASTNTSNTAGALISQGAISGGLWYLDPFVAAFGAGSQYAFGKLLASPRFARLLAGAPRQDNPQARRAFASRLGNLAQSEPTIAREIAAYQRAIAANDNVAGSLAAEEQQDIPQ